MMQLQYPASARQQSSAALKGTQMSTTARTAVPDSKTPVAIMASYGMGKYLAEFFTGAFGALVFKFYETEIGLPASYAAIGIILYSIWNAVNDPLIGYLTFRPTPLASRLGRRFPWIAFGAFLWVFTFVAIFAVPPSLDAVQRPLPVFIWMVVSTCLFDTLYTLWEVNYQSVFPDKFRGTPERNKTAGIATAVGILGIAVGFLLPTMFIRYGQPASYLSNAWVFVAIGLAGVFLLLPGVREDKGMIDRYLADVEARKRGEIKSEGFFTQLKQALAHRNFMAFILLYFFYQSAMMSMTASIHYIGDYVLPGGSGDTTLIFAGMLAGALVSVPMWMFLGRRIGSNQRTLVVSASVMAVFSFPMFFVSTQVGFTVLMTLWGLGFGGFWLFMTPALADVVDELVLRTGKREDGLYMGFRAFFGRLSYASQALIFWAVHGLTGFSVDPRSATAVMGIKLHLAVIPAGLVLVGIGLFACMNSITGASARLVRDGLRKEGL
jgi:GPH family glycoside/pentoside/hexuronide:cation symporter